MIPVLKCWFMAWCSSRSCSSFAVRLNMSQYWIAECRFQSQWTWNKKPSDIVVSSQTGAEAKRTHVQWLVVYHYFLSITIWELRRLVWRRCSTRPSRCRRQCRPSWRWVEWHVCWGRRSCPKDGSCTSHRPVTAYSWPGTPDDDPLGRCSPLLCPARSDHFQTVNTWHASRIVQQIPITSVPLFTNHHKRMTTYTFLWLCDELLIYVIVTF